MSKRETNIPHVPNSKFLIVVEKLLSPGTRRCYYYELVVTGIRIILKRGWRVFWSNLREYIVSGLSMWKQKCAFRKTQKKLRNQQADGKGIYEKAYESMLKVAIDKQSSEYIPLSQEEYQPVDTMVKLIAFYLPQFHPVPENDMWWGKGFTEWTNVSKAIPQFVGHYHPRLPGELGFYDLRVIDVQKRQIELARKYGIYGFCFHYYWFGGKCLLEQPLNQILSNPGLNFPFCLCWANENWTRRWDGRESEILMEQTHSQEDDIQFIQSIEIALSDKRYIHINERPLLIVYNITQMPNPKTTAECWREYCRRKGLGDLYLVAAQTFGFTDPRPFGFDAAVQFPPNNIDAPEVTHEIQLLNSNFSGKIYDYKKLVEKELLKNSSTPYELFYTVFPNWDNEPRRPGRGHIFVFSTPEVYAKWLRYACNLAMKKEDEEKRLVFINSWNEWAEGAYLEPDRRYGYAYLQATVDTLQSLAKSLSKKPGEPILLH